MNLLDIIILLTILITGVIGFKRGVFKEIILFIGLIVVVILAYNFKNYIGDFLVLNVPFLKFSFFKGAEAINIIFYQSIAFVLMGLILYVIYEFIVSLTGIFEKILRFTIILGVPSKILGLFVGLIEGYVIAFVITLFISQPALNLKFADESQYRDFILTKTPFLTEIASDTLKLTKDLERIASLENVNDINLQIVDLILDKKVTSVSIIEKLVDKGKLNIKDIDTIINKYKGENND